MFAVSVTEIEADGDDPLHWLLLATEHPAEGEADTVHATTVLGWYRLTWTVETWFRTLKTGTQTKDRRLDSADDLSKCLSFDAVTAAHVADITVLARERPDTGCGCRADGLQLNCGRRTDVPVSAKQTTNTTHTEDRAMKKFGSIFAAVASTTLVAQAEAQKADCSFWTNPHKHWGLEDRFFKIATIEQVRDCLNAGANPNLRFSDSSKKRTSPLIYLAKRGDGAIVELLLNAGGNEHVYAALLEAATNGHAEIVATLLAAGQNPSVLIDSRVMGNAARNGHVDVVRALLSAGADPLVATGAIGAAAELGHTRVVTLLLNAGVDPYPSRALGKAAFNGHADVVAVLLTAGADPNAALGQAAMNGYAEIVALLLDAGANPNGDRTFALRVAAENGHAEAVITLLEAGADPVPALMAAISRGHTEIVAALEAAGAR